MSKAAFTARIFGVYLFILGPVLVVAPNVLLSLFGIPATTEVWIRVVGVIVFMLGVKADAQSGHPALTIPGMSES